MFKKILIHIVTFISFLIATLLILFLADLFFSFFIAWPNMYEGVCSGEECWGYFFIVPPLIIIYCIALTIATHLKGRKKSIILFVVILALTITTLYIVSARQIYLNDKLKIASTVEVMSKIDAQIHEVAKEDGAKACVDNLSYETILVGTLPNLSVTTSNRTTGFNHIDGNGLTSEPWNHFSLFKISKDKTIDNVNVAVRKINYMNNFGGASNNRKYVIYTHLNYEDLYEIRKGYTYKEHCRGYEIENLGKNNEGKPIILISGN
jgi:hypothetical protein